MIAVAGAVLAGGRSSRMGRDKALITVDGSMMVVRVAQALAAAGCDPVVVVGDRRDALDEIGLTVIDDRWPGEGPLGGIISALMHFEMPTVVAACDLPWLDASTLRSLWPAPGVDVVVAATDREQPLCACWMPSALPRLRQSFDAGERAVHHALEGLKTVRVQVTPAAVRNVNTPGDLPTM